MADVLESFKVPTSPHSLQCSADAMQHGYEQHALQANASQDEPDVQAIREILDMHVIVCWHRSIRLLSNGPSSFGSQGHIPTPIWFKLQPEGEEAAETQKGPGSTAACGIRRASVEAKDAKVEEDMGRPVDGFATSHDFHLRSDPAALFSRAVGNCGSGSTWRFCG